MAKKSAGKSAPKASPKTSAKISAKTSVKIGAASPSKKPVEQKSDLAAKNETGKRMAPEAALGSKSASTKKIDSKNTDSKKSDSKKSMEPKAASKSKSKADSVKEFNPGISGVVPQGSAAEVEKWLTLRKEHGDEKAANYRMSDSFAVNTPLVHPRLGWGFILNNQNDRLEVLFESGLKILISNYKS